jgi:hypothetical protein
MQTQTTGARWQVLAIFAVAPIALIAIVIAAIALHG